MLAIIGIYLLGAIITGALLVRFDPYDYSDDKEALIAGALGWPAWCMVVPVAWLFARGRK